MKKLRKILIVFALISFFSFVPVYAQGANLSPSGGTNGASNGNPGNVDPNIGIQPLHVALFSNFININTKNASVFTWVSFAGVLATIGLVIFWVALIVKAGVKALQSQGSPEGLQEAFKQAQSVMVGAVVSFIFPFVLSVIGIFLGIGSVFNWPKMFEFCEGSKDYEFYYQAYLKHAEATCTGGDTSVN